MVQKIVSIRQPILTHAVKAVANVSSQSSTEPDNKKETLSREAEFPAGYKVATAIGRGIIGQGSYLVSEETNPEYWNWNKKIFEIAKKEGLDPFDVVYSVCRRDKLLKTAARGGFAENISHWKNGMEYYDMYKGHEFNIERIYEMIINNDPSFAYLLDGNDLVDQKLVMCHCMGHSDFFKNNINFRFTNRSMLNRIAEHKKYQERVLNEENVSFQEMEKFLEKAFSVDGLIDYSNLEPRQLKYELHQNRVAEKVPDSFGVLDVTELPSHMQGRINDPERIHKEREVEKERLEKEALKVPKYPDYDVMAFIIEHSKVLKPWQRQILSNAREQAYYFAPQPLTKIMNEGWAVYWHRKLMAHPEIVDLRDASAFADHNAGIIAIGGGRINPYRVGYEILMDIEERWNTGRHGKNWEEMEDGRTQRDYDDKSMKGFKKIFEVRKLEKDSTFIDKYLTPEVAEKLKLFTWKEEDGEIIIDSKKFKDVKKKLVQQLFWAGQPSIAVRDGNYDNKGELLLHHDFDFDLKEDYAIETLKNLLSMWGGAVHLNTKVYANDKLTPARITAEYATVRQYVGMGTSVSKPSIKITFKRAEEKVNEETGLVDYNPTSETLRELNEELKP